MEFKIIMGTLVKRIVGTAVALALLAPTVQAHEYRDGPRWANPGPIEWRGGDWHGHDGHGGPPPAAWRPGPPQGYYRPGPPPPAYSYRHSGPPPWVRTLPPDRWRVYHDVVIVRPYGHWYHGYGHFYDDDAALAFLGFTAISFALLNALSEAQQRAHEEAQIRATNAPVGQPIIWSDGGASGTVVALREGHTGDGRYCREFQQNVTIGGRSEQAYGTACRQPDGTWQIVDQ